MGKKYKLIKISSFHWLLSFELLSFQNVFPSPDWYSVSKLEYKQTAYRYQICMMPWTCQVPINKTDLLIMTTFAGL